MNIKYYEILVEENKKEIKHLNLLLSELEENKRNILEKEYIYEVGRINYYLEKEEEKLEENKLIINSYKIIINELKQIEKLKEYKINDKYDKEQYEYELNKRNEIIEYYKKNISSTLYIEIEKEITKDKIEENNNTKEEKSDVQEKKENNKNDDVILLSSSVEDLNIPKNNEDEETKVEDAITEDNSKVIDSNVILLPASSEELTKAENKPTDSEINVEPKKESPSSNVILLPSKSEELTKENNSEIKTGIKYEYTIEEIKEKEEECSINEEKQNVKIEEDSNKEHKNEVSKDEGNKTGENEEKNSEESKKEDKKTELKVETVHTANSTLKSKVIEKVRKYGIQALVIISTGAVLSLAINPTAAFYIVGFGSIIGLNIKSRFDEKINKKMRKKGKYLKK